MVSIQVLRRNRELLKNLGNREKDILFSKDAKAKVDNDFPPKGSFVEVFSKSLEKSFVFAMKDNTHADKYEVVN